MQHTRIAKVGVWLLVATASAAGLPVRAQEAEPRPLAAESPLYTSQGQGLSGLLSSGTPVQVLERQGTWVRVRVEGWVRATAVDAPSVVSPGLPAPLPGSPAVADAPPSANPTGPRALIEGSLKLKKKLFKAGAAGSQLWLLPAASRAELEEENSNGTDSQRLEALEAEAAGLAQQADRAMREISSFMDATQTHDKLMARREAVLVEREQILAARHGRHEAQARRVALDSAVVDSRGWFSFADTRPGAYTIYARVVREGLDVEWIETVEVAATGSARVDLDETSARGLLRESS